MSGEEFIKIFTIAQYLTKLAPLIKNADNKINNFINKYFIIKTSNRKNKEKKYSVEYPRKLHINNDFL